ncbi:hypothetical protein C922_04457 [Plasmodium inui San Antonio 1]|uniref:Uncharacterized protein n=1 Tax=Plasmodium inui San Antonio 1 TaxID=1237626 RepID=W7AIP7_9APIC|nr:hypothetical protein C922_04457 [Plasmodium inui San Antonio 1]EUD65171.1 hypothetical protein C922_04457 [Plasmodium inui San Antonio 1]
MDLFGINSGHSSCKGRGRAAQGRTRRARAVRGRLIKPKPNSEEREKETNLFSVNSGEDKIGTEGEKRRALGKKRGFLTESVKDEDSSGADRKKNKKRKVRSKCLFSSISDGGSHKSEAGKLEEKMPQGRNSNCLFSSDEEEANRGETSLQGRSSNCLFSSDVEEVNRGETNLQERSSNCLFSSDEEEANRGETSLQGSNPSSLFSSTSEETPQSESEVKGKNKSRNGEGAKLQGRMCIREGNFHLNMGEKEKSKRQKKTSSFANFGLHRRAKILNRCRYQTNGGRSTRGRSRRRGTPYYDLHDTREEGMYRLISFEKLKKRASRKLNFMSIVDMTNGGGDSSGSSSRSSVRSSACSSTRSSARSLVRSREGVNPGGDTTDTTADSEEDVLNRTGVSYVASSESTKESKNDSAALNDERNNNKTIDVYSYYYLGSDVDKLVPYKNVEKMEDSGNCIGGDNLYDRLFGLDGGEVTSGGMHRIMSKDETPELHRGTSLKMRQPRNEVGRRNNAMLQRNLRLYRNFKNINVEVSRQNNLKGLNFKEMVVNFIRLVNKNMLAMSERGEMDLSQEGNHSREDFKDTSDVEEWYVTRGDVAKGEQTQTEPSLQKAEKQHTQLELAKCVCIFCLEKKKILTNEEMHVSTFKYMDERKKEDTVIKPFFMHSYVFTAFINYFIHYGRVACVQRGQTVKGGGRSGGEKPAWANLQFYKFDRKVTKKYGIKRVILFVARRVTLTSVGIHMEGSNMLQENEEFVVVINFFKWRMMRRRYEEIVKLKRRKKEKENLSILKTFIFLVKAIDEYCMLCNIRVDQPKGKKDFCERKRRHMSQPICKKEDNTHRNGCSTLFGHSYFSHNQVRVGQIEDALNQDLANSPLQFAIVDSLRVSAGSTFYLFPAHMLVLI